MSASKIIASDVAVEEVMPMEELIAQIKALSLTDLVKLNKQLASCMEKASKSAVKSTTKKVVNKVVNPNRGKQLVKPRAWVNFVLNHARQNGWESFAFSQNKTDKVTKEKTQEVQEMPGSECIDGVYYFEGTKKTMIPKYAMALSKIYKIEKPELYQEFDKNYVVPSDSEVEASSVSEVEEKEEKEKEEKEEKEKPKKTKKVSDKSEEENQKKEEKPKKERKTKKVSDKSEDEKEEKPKKAKKAKKVSDKSEEEEIPSAVMTGKKPVAKKMKKVENKDDFVAPDTGFAEWTYKGVKYHRNNENELFKFTDSGDVDPTEDWVGVYLSEEDRIDAVDIPEKYLD
jgi:hypothetical protein